MKQPDRRLTSTSERIDLVSDADLELRLEQCLRKKSLPDYFLYLGHQGVDNWLDLDRSAEFPIAERLSDLLRDNIGILIKQLPAVVDMVSIGAGDGKKELMILQQLYDGARQVSYFAVDISREMVDEALKAVENIPIETTGITSFGENLYEIGQIWNQPVLLCFLGNNFCNYDPNFLLTSINEVLTNEDYFLFDCHLKPEEDPGQQWQEKVKKAYRCDRNIQFNIGPLVRRGLDPKHCRFSLDLLPLETKTGNVMRTRKKIEILERTVLLCNGRDIVFEPGDDINMGLTYKYTLGQVRMYLEFYGFHITDEVTNSDNTNAILLAKRQNRKGDDYGN